MKFQSDRHRAGQIAVTATEGTEPRLIIERWQHAHELHGALALRASELRLIGRVHGPAIYRRSNSVP